MAAFTVSVNRNFEDAAFSTRAGNDTYAIDTGATLTIDTDSRYCTNATVTTGNLGAVTISSTSGGKLLIDGTKVRIIPYNTGAGTVPAIGTSITQGAVSGYLLGVWSAFNAAPTAVGAAMPASGYIKVKNVTGGNYSAGALGGISASATGADVVGWIEVVGVEATTCTVPRLGTFQMTGAWFEVGTTSGAANQTIQMPASLAATYYPGVWIETAASSGIYEFYPSAGTATTTRTDAAGKVVWISSQGLLRIGNSGAATNGYTPASGLKIRVPNIITINVTAAAMATNALPNATLATRWDFTTTGGGVINIDKANLAWFPSFAQAFSVSITNTGIHENLNISELASPITLTQVGVGQTAAQAQLALTMLLCFAGGTITDCVFSRATYANGAYAVSMTDCFGFDFTNTVTRACVNRSSTTSGGYTLTRVKDGSWTNADTIGAKVALLVTCSDLTFTTVSYCDAVSGTTPTTTGQYIMGITADSGNITVDGMDFFGIANVNPYAGLFNIITGSSNLKIRNLGTAASPLDLGPTNAAAVLIVGAAGAGVQNVEMKRIYTSTTRTGFLTNVDNSHNKITFQNVWVDAADTLTFASLNTIAKGMRGVNVTTGQTSVYGVHWFDLFDAATTGRIGIAMNEKTTVEPSASSYQVVVGGVGFGFDSVGRVVMPNLNDEVIWTTPYYIIGHISFQNVAPTITGVNVSGGTAPVYGNFSLYYKIDKNNGSGYGGSWTNLTAAILSGETGIDASLGFKLQVRAVVTTASATNALTYITIPTNTNSTALAYQYPLDTYDVVLQNIVVGSRYDIYNITTSTSLAQGTAGATTVTVNVPATVNDTLRIRVRKSSGGAEYVPFETNATVATTGASVYVSQVVDTIAS